MAGYRFEIPLRDERVYEVSFIIDREMTHEEHQQMDVYLLDLIASYEGAAADPDAELAKPQNRGTLIAALRQIIGGGQINVVKVGDSGKKVKKK